MSLWSSIMGSGPKTQREAIYNPEQMAALQQLTGYQRQTAPQVVDFLQNLISGQQGADAFKPVALREFQQETIPGLAEEFTALLGEGGLRSGGYEGALANAQAGLAERLALHEQERQMQQNQLGLSASAQLANYLSPGFNQQYQEVTTPGRKGLLGYAIPAIGTAAGMFLGGPGGAALGNSLGQGLAGMFSKGGQAGAKAGSSAWYKNPAVLQQGMSMLGAQGGGLLNFAL